MCGLSPWSSCCLIGCLLAGCAPASGTHASVATQASPDAATGAPGTDVGASTPVAAALDAATLPQGDDAEDSTLPSTTLDAGGDASTFTTLDAGNSAPPSTTPDAGGAAPMSSAPDPLDEVDAGLSAPFPGSFGSQIGPTVRAATSPPPISGGTLLVSRDGTFAVVSDPERDHVDVVDLASRTLTSTLVLMPGDEPGRAVEDGARRVHVVLRGGGAVATVDLASHAVIGRSHVCPLPRGIAYNSVNDTVVVACAGGELVTLPAAGGAATQTVLLDQDLRDVLVVGGSVYVTRFREAELLAIDASGNVSRRFTPAGQTGSGGAIAGQSTVAWRAVATADGHVVMLHQYAQTGDDMPVFETTGGYAGSTTSEVSNGRPCNGAIVQAALSVLDPTTPPTTPGSSLASVTLGVDVAISPDGARIAVASAGNLPVNGPGTDQAVMESAFATLAPTGSPSPTCLTGHFYNNPTGEVVAVAYTLTGEVIAQTREPAGIYFTASGATLTLATDSREDTGHTLFHANAGGGLACASCHPEGMDDGHVWTFSPTGPRRTQSLRGDLLSRMPFHWDGDLSDMGAIANQVFDVRMGGGPLTTDQVNALGHWLNALPALAAPTLSSSADALVAQGMQLFNDPTVGCTGCHTGSLYTNDALVDVGTGGTFKVPSLLAVSWQAPYLHDGCAPTLRDRFTNTACGGGDQHGHTSQLQPSDLDALVAYLSTL